MACEDIDFPNPVIAAQASDFPLVADFHQGHTMPAGKEFIGPDDYLSIDEVIAEARRSRKPIILNIGDSSTSGWDSNVVTRNRELRALGEPLLPTFFQYPTYADLLRGKVGSDYVVVNAGVPAHTSIQGSRRLGLLLDRLHCESVEVHWVTIYFGNNDSVWDGNRQDKDWVGINSAAEYPTEHETAVITRSLPSDYKTAMGDIVRTCRRFGATPVVIEPITPLYWKPGTRVRGEDLGRTPKPGSSLVYRLLDEARDLWSTAMATNGDSALKVAALAEAAEKDYIIPRIKRPHLAVLRQVVEELEVSTVSVDLDRSQDDMRYFIDYCHPIGDANQRIADAIAEVIAAGRTSAVAAERPVLGDQALRRDPVGGSTLLDLPLDHYTLY